MLKIGLTGGIGSGKTTASQHFSALGVPVIDTDQLARELLRKGETVFDELCRHFGTEILDTNGELDRATLRQRVFSDPASLGILEALLHPKIRSAIQQQISHIDSPYVIIAIPLLVEKAWQAEVDRILVVDCEEQMQLERASQRDNGDMATIRKIMMHQASREQRLAVAHDIIHNDGDLNSLHEQVCKLHYAYMELSQSS